MRKHEFLKFMSSVKISLAVEYERIRSRSLEDPGTAGDEAEENWAEIFRNWLPANYPIVTKGRILNEDGEASPQIDLLILRPHYPMHLRDKKMFFAAGVIAAFDCKLTLRPRDIDKAFKNAAIIKRLMSPRNGSPYEELNQLPICGLLAHSHGWKAKPADFKIFHSIENYQIKYCKHPREMLDVICVADAATYVFKKRVAVGSHLSQEGKAFLKEQKVPSAVGTICFFNSEEEGSWKEMDSKGEILGNLIFELTKRMAYEDESLRAFSNYLGNTWSFWGIGRFVLWKEIVLSEKVRQRLKSKGYEDDSWSKWSEQLD